MPMLSRKDLTAAPKEALPLRRRNYKDLTAEEKIFLHQKLEGKEITAVDVLSKEEELIFAPGIPPGHLQLQRLYKCRDLPKQESLQARLTELTAANESLRSLFIPYPPALGGRIKKVVLAARDAPLPPLPYQKLPTQEATAKEKIIANLLAADRKNDFDLTAGPLWRLTILQTGENEWAVLITFSALLEPYFNPAALLSPEEIALPGFRVAPRQQQAEKEITPPPLPFAKPVSHNYNYRQRSYQTKLPGNIARGVQKFAGAKRLSILAILVTAWQIFLSENATQGAVTSLLLLTAPQFRLLPLKLSQTENQSWEKIVARQEQQIAAAWETEQPDLRGCGFNHLLGCGDFLQGELSYNDTPASPQGRLVTENVWAAQGASLGLYFGLRQGELTLTFLYDEQGFKPYGIELMTRQYIQFLQQMLLDWKQPLRANVPTPPPAVPSALGLFSGLPGELIELELMAGVESASLKKDILHPGVRPCLMGDRLSPGDIRENYIFVAKGKVSRNLDDGDGHSNFIDIKGPGAWVNPGSVLPDSKGKISVEVMSEEAKLVLIPKAEMERLLNDEPIVQRRLLLMAVAEMEKYQLLWIRL